jgi:hypothetical protein
MFKFLKNFHENLDLQKELKRAQQNIDIANGMQRTYVRLFEENRDKFSRLQSQVDFHVARVQELEQKNKIYEELILKFNLREKGHEID